MQQDQFDKLTQIATAIIGIIALVALLYLGYGSESVIVPIILAIIAGLTSFESGRRRQKRR